MVELAVFLNDFLLFRKLYLEAESNKAMSMQTYLPKKQKKQTLSKQHARSTPKYLCKNETFSIVSLRDGVTQVNPEPTCRLAE